MAASGSRVAASCPTSPGSSRRPWPTSSAAALRRRRDRDPTSRRRPACTAPASTRVTVGDTTLQPDARRTASRSPTDLDVHVTFANQGENDEFDVKVTVDRSEGGGKTIKVRKHGRHGRAGRRRPTVEIPLRQDAADRRRRCTVNVESRRSRARRRPTTTSRPTTSSSRRRADAPRPRVSSAADGRALTDAGGHRRPRRRARLALVALAGAARASRRACGGCAPRSGRCSASAADRPRRPRRGAAAGVRRAARRRRGRRRAPRRAAGRPPRTRLDGAIAYRSLVRYDAYGELSGHQSTSIALLDAEHNGVVLSSIAHRDPARLYCKQVHRRRRASSSSRPRRTRPCGSRWPARSARATLRR